MSSLQAAIQSHSTWLPGCEVEYHAGQAGAFWLLDRDPACLGTEPLSDPLFLAPLAKSMLALERADIPSATLRRITIPWLSPVQSAELNRLRHEQAARWSVIVGVPYGQS